jgi:F-type H+-transporting ATPase subunit epsilon
LHRFATAWGFAEVLPDRVTVLAETVERAEEIDVKRAQQSLAKAEEELKSAETEEEVATDLGKVRRAQARIDISANKSSPA